MNFQEITEQDIERLSKLFISSFNQPPWNEAWTMNTASARLQQLIKSPDFFGLMLVEEKQVQAMAIGHFESFYNGTDFFIREFCVANHLTRTGIGSRFLQAFEQQLSLKGATSIYLLTSSKHRIDYFYRKNDYTIDTDFVIMRKSTH